ncbi:MAG: glycosyltransferase family 4 protein [Terriglobales bacterium]
MHALVTADSIGGVWTYARELVTGLCQRGLRVTLVSFGEIPTAAQTAWMDGLADLDFRPTAFQLEWMQGAEHDLALSRDYLQAVIRETAPDIIHLNQYCYGALETDAPKIVVAHSDVMSWWVAVHGEEPRDTRWMRWYRDTVLAGLEGATAVVAPSQWMLDAIRLHYCSPAQARVIHNGRTPTLFNPHVTKEDYIVSVGRLWDGGKQTALLTRIHPPLPVYIAGSEQHPDASLRNDSRRSARKQVQFKGQLSEEQLRQLYSRAAIYAATSRYEPFGLAPLEAALSRCAIVANDIPTFRELWGDSAFYFRYNDAASLQGALYRLAGDPEMRIAYANLAYQRARECFTAERMVSDYLSLYQALTKAEVAA